MAIPNKAEVVLRLVESLNQGDCYDYDERVDMAMTQYKQLVRAGIFYDPRMKNTEEEEAHDRGNW